MPMVFDVAMLPAAPSSSLLHLYVEPEGFVRRSRAGIAPLHGSMTSRQPSLPPRFPPSSPVARVDFALSHTLAHAARESANAPDVGLPSLPPPLLHCPSSTVNSPPRRPRSVFSALTLCWPAKFNEVDTPLLPVRRVYNAIKDPRDLWRMLPIDSSRTDEAVVCCREERGGIFTACFPPRYRRHRFFLFLLLLFLVNFGIH